MPGNGQWLTRPVVFPAPWPKDHRPGTGGTGDPSADRVYHGRPGKVDKAELFEPAAAFVETTPGPTAKNRVNEGTDENSIDQVAAKLGTFGHGAGTNRRRRAGKHHLEQPEGKDPRVLFCAEIAEEQSTTSPLSLRNTSSLDLSYRFALVRKSKSYAKKKISEYFSRYQ